MEKNKRDLNFNKWFHGSKVTDINGKPLRVYHGTSRPDRIGKRFLPSRATSGPMPFFTDDPEIATGYATGKRDTSLNFEGDYSDWFKIKIPGFRNPIKVSTYWYHMDSSKKREVMEKLPHISDRDDDDNELNHYTINKSYALSSKDHWEWAIKRSGGNYIDAAIEIWLNSGMLMGNERDFIEILKIAGIKGVEYHDPERMNPAIIPVYLSIKNPLDTGNIPKEVVEKLDQVSSKKRGKQNKYGAADLWDKNYVSGREWVRRLKDDIQNGTTHSWTSIPDWVTDTLKGFGYDGIKDTGGKYHEKKHNVWVPFYPEQIKSAYGNKGSFDPTKKNMTEKVRTFYTMKNSIEEARSYLHSDNEFEKVDREKDNRKKKALGLEVKNDWEYSDSRFKPKEGEVKELRRNDNRKPEDYTLGGDYLDESEAASEAKRMGKRTARQISNKYGLYNDHIVDKELYTNLPPKPTEYHHFITDFGTKNAEIVKRNMYLFNPERNPEHKKILDNIRKYIDMKSKETEEIYNNMVSTLEKSNFNFDRKTGLVSDESGSYGIFKKEYINNMDNYGRNFFYSKGIRKKVLRISFNYTVTDDKNISRKIAKEILKLKKIHESEYKNIAYLDIDEMLAESLSSKVIRLVQKIK